MWAPETPQINDDDILAYSEYLAAYAKAVVKPKEFCNSLSSFFIEHLADDVIDGRTRGQWIDAHEKRFAILEAGTYNLVYYCPDGYTCNGGSIQVTARCILDVWNNDVSIPLEHEPLCIDVKPTHSELEIKSLDLPMFSRFEHSCGVKST